MSKNKTIKLGSLLGFVSIIFAIAAVCMIFVPSININGTISGTNSYSGTNATFGYTSNNVEIFSFSFLNLLTYLLPLVAIVLMVLRMAGICKSKICDYLAVGLLIVSAVFFFLMPTFSISPYVDSFTGVLDGTVTMSLAIGAILGGIFAIISAIALLAKNFVK